MLLRTVGCVLAFGLSAFAQREESKISVDMESFRYPRIAAQAFIEGEFLFSVSGSERKLISQQSNVERAAQLLGRCPVSTAGTTRSGTAS